MLFKVIYHVLVSVSALPFTVKATSYVPAIEYVWVGFCKEDVFPSPKSQLQEVIPAEPVLASVKVIVVPSQTNVASAEKS